MSSNACLSIIVVSNGWILHVCWRVFLFDKNPNHEMKTFHNDTKMGLHLSFLLILTAWTPKLTCFYYCLTTVFSATYTIFIYSSRHRSSWGNQRWRELLCQWRQPPAGASTWSRGQLFWYFRGRFLSCKLQPSPSWTPWSPSSISTSSSCPFWSYSSDGAADQSHPCLWKKSLHWESCQSHKPQRCQNHHP